MPDSQAVDQFRTPGYSIHVLFYLEELCEQLDNFHFAIPCAVLCWVTACVNSVQNMHTKDEINKGYFVKTCHFELAFYGRGNTISTEVLNISPYQCHVWVFTQHWITVPSPRSEFLQSSWTRASPTRAQCAQRGNLHLPAGNDKLPETMWNVTSKGLGLAFS